jgi:hypothetical protein
MGSEVHPSPANWLPEGHLLVVKRPGLEADYSPLSNFEVNDAGAIIPLSELLCFLVLN